MQLISGIKDWKHVSVQKVVTLTLLAWHSSCHRSQPVLFRATNVWRNATLLSVRWKKFCILQGSVVTFSCVVGKGVTVCFPLRYGNVHNLKYVWIILLKNDFFWISQGKVATLYRWVGKCISYWCQIFSGFDTPKSLKSVNFWQSYSKNKKVDVFGDTVYNPYYQKLANGWVKLYPG